MSNYFKAFSFLKKGIGGTTKSDQIKKSNKILKGLDKTMKKDMSPEMKAKGEKLKKEVQGIQKEVYKSGFKNGGRIGFKKGTGRSGVPAMDIKSTPTKKLSEKQKKIARLAGDPQRIDKPDFAKLRNKNKKVI